MSAGAAVPIAERARPLTALPLMTQLPALLALIFGGLRGFVHARAGRGRGADCAVLPAPRRWDLLPPWLLREFAYSNTRDLRMRLATADQYGAAQIETRAAWAEIRLPVEFSKAPGRGHAWRRPDAGCRAAAAKLSQFPLTVSLLVDGFDSLLAIWLLDDVARLDDRRTLARVEALQEQLAQAVGGRLDVVREPKPAYGSPSWPGRPDPIDTWPAWSPLRPALRLPGSRNMSCGGALGEEVVLVHADASRRYSLGQLEAAIAPAPPSNGKTSTSRRK